MCGRITQYRSPADYAAALGWAPENVGPDQHEPLSAYNVAPGTYPLVMHRLDEGHPVMEHLHWGYRPAWAEAKGIPMAINARVEKAVTGRYFRHMWKGGRIVVPADGWYEWAREPGSKQPWYIYSKNGHPLFMAAITNYRPDRENPEGTGFVIVTAAADTGLLDIHDRRPVVLGAEDAELWMDPHLPVEQAEYIVRTGTRPPKDFEWHTVSTKVNYAGNNSASLIEPA